MLTIEFFLDETELSLNSIEFFVFGTKLLIIAMLAPRDFANAKELPPMGLDVMITGSRI